ncbi:hypothetical protein SMACR_08808 [Sordaria macrospora]|uniref:WGS project CABT00000000 data, contig 2.66 n=2 Tax=Sordaria macrospora TaxID=5147 RepID=F7WAV4_SORMK|nr:uncharacterized protein SMAC_08808 [Sordaria macrospora k-hell]KAA8628298.1 hypothetical protein SMACR_08808 [Sordaria macrospora]KAH7631486.1 hypothetical protein B0T09DRAFT_396783 [Sordaria sp. MPI-SDFR-AT-0083]WPJ62813.1 hypothetical protein SMAC4_08808 [Sordaria macrospora]CCC14269.1 unnamed protein product [Sordaria macrospora k-hell]
MGGGLVFTGMPRRREVLGTGIIRWAKVVNPDGSVTWQEAQPTSTVNSNKEEKGTQTEKQVLERPSWIDYKKESSVRVSKRRATDVVEWKAKELKVEARPTRAFSFKTEEKEILRTEKTSDSKVCFNTSTQDDKKEGFVAGLATKFGSTTKFEALPLKKASAETQSARPLIERRNAEDLHSNKLKAQDSRSHWSTQSDPKQGESDAELALRLANTEKIFRQQEQKIQAALDRIRDLERQLATGFATSTPESDDTQSKTSSSEVTENDSIAAGGREAGPHFRTLVGEISTSMSATTKGPLPFSRDEPHYRVLTVNSSKPQLCTVDEVNHHHELEGSTGEISDNSRTPSPIEVDATEKQQEQQEQPRSPAPCVQQLDPIVNDAPRSHTYRKLRVINTNTPATILNLKPNTPTCAINIPHTRDTSPRPRTRTFPWTSASNTHGKHLRPPQTPTKIRIHLQETAKNSPTYTNPRGAVLVEEKAEGREDEEDVEE